MKTLGRATLAPQWRLPPPVKGCHLAAFSTAGALVGKAGDMDNKDDSAALIEQAAQKLEEGDIAVIALADETNEEVLDHALVKFNTVVVRYDAEVIAKELEEAEKMEEELARQARETLRSAEKKEDK